MIIRPPFFVCESTVSLSFIFDNFRILVRRSASNERSDDLRHFRQLKIRALSTQSVEKHGATRSVAPEYFINPGCR